MVVPAYIDEYTSSAANSLVGIHTNVRLSGNFIYRTVDSAGYPVTGDWVLIDPEEDALRVASAVAPGSPVLLVSAKTGEGIELFKQFFKPGETLGVLGKNGVGKSALIGALGASQGGIVSRPFPHSEGIMFLEQPRSDSAPLEGEVRASDRKGRHTTTASRLYRLASGLLIIDSPGIRELKIWGDQGDLDTSFSDIAELSRQCRFSDSTHSREPGCAVLAALAEGSLDKGRYRSYLQLQREQAWLDSRLDDQSLRAEKAHWKQIAKTIRGVQKGRR